MANKYGVPFHRRSSWEIGHSAHRCASLSSFSCNQIFIRFSMVKTLLLLKLLVGRDLRDRAVLTSQHVYATFLLNSEIEVRSHTVQHGGRNPEWNQLFLLEVGPWWRNKELVIQVFAKNKVLADSFIGGVKMTLGDLTRAVGLDDDSHASAHHAHAPLPLEGAPGQSREGAAAVFKKVTSAECHGMGELLPVLPETVEEDDEPGGSALPVSASSAALLTSMSGSSSSFSTAAASFSPRTLRQRSPSVVADEARARNSAPLHRRSSSSSLLTNTLPLTWLLLSHGGGPAKLKQYPLPQWSLPAGRILVYLDYVVLGDRRIPGLMSSVLPASWQTLNENEKLAWAAMNRKKECERRAPGGENERAGGVLGLVQAWTGVGGGQGHGPSSPQTPPRARSASNAALAVASPSYPVYSHRGSLVGVAGAMLPPAGVSPRTALILAYVLRPVAFLVRQWDQLQRAQREERIFYSWFFTLSFVILLTEWLFRPSTAASATSSLPAFISFFLPQLLGLLIFQLAWNMLHDAQLSHPWRRLDLVGTMVLGMAVGSSSARISASGPAEAKILATAALVMTHAYARAGLYGQEVVRDVAEARRALTKQRSANDNIDANPLTTSFFHSLLLYTFTALTTAYHTAGLWVTGALQHERGSRARNKAIPGVIHLSLRSAFFVVGQIVVGAMGFGAPNGEGSVATNASFINNNYSLSFASLVSFLVPSFLFLILFLFASTSNQLAANPAAAAAAAFTSCSTDARKAVAHSGQSQHAVFHLRRTAILTRTGAMACVGLLRATLDLQIPAPRPSCRALSRSVVCSATGI